MTPQQLLNEADQLLTRSTADSRGRWPRACAWLIRLALEKTLDQYWARILPEAAGFCRSALEAACHETVRNRRIGTGARHSEIEQALTHAQTLHQVAALAAGARPLPGSPSSASASAGRCARLHGLE